MLQAIRRIRWRTPEQGDAIAPPKRAKQLWHRWGLAYLVLFVVAVGLAAVLLRVAVEWNSGLELTYSPKVKPSFVDCVYFSVVTISSLGYGDIRPIGWGRLIAGFEVTSGLVIIGMWISYLSSRRSEVLTRRLHDYVADGRLKRYRVNIARLSKELAALAERQAGRKDLSHRRSWSAGKHSEDAVLDELHALVSGLVRFVRHEVTAVDFFDITPGAAINRLLGACVRCVEVIGEVSKQGPILDSGNPGATGNLTRRTQILRNLSVLADCIVRCSPDGRHRVASRTLAASIALLQPEDLNG